MSRIYQNHGPRPVFVCVHMRKSAEIGCQHCKYVDEIFDEICCHKFIWCEVDCDHCQPLVSDRLVQKLTHTKTWMLILVISVSMVSHS